MPEKRSCSIRSQLALLLPICCLGLLAMARWGGAAGGAYDDKEKPDPIKANGTIFKTKSGEDWPKPDALLVITGEQDGYLEPCGCAGLTNQKGGLKRRHTFLKQLKAKDWPFVALDAGGQIKRYGVQAQIKLNNALQSLVELGYQGVGFGVRDLRMEMVGVAINLDENANPLTSANIDLIGLSKPWRVAETGGMKIGFTSVLSDQQAKGIGESRDFELRTAAEGLREVTPLLEAENCDHLVLLVYGSADEARALARQFPAYRWVVSAVGADVPPIEMEKIEGTESHLIEVGHKGMYAVTVGLYKSGSKPFRYQPVPLDHRFEDSEEMQQMLIDYQGQLKSLGFEELGVKPQLHPSTEATGGKFAGSEACADCHDEEYEIWKKTPHSHATQTLVKLDPARHFDPECLSCHVTGWSPQKYHPFVSGFESLDKTPQLNANGCENCHGPGARHVQAENAEIDVTEEERLALVAALRLKIGENEGNKLGQNLGDAVNNCLECHDEDNSPDFDFQKYWPKVKHGG